VLICNYMIARRLSLRTKGDGRAAVLPWRVCTRFVPTIESCSPRFERTGRLPR
jgi:hypothetical protein